MNLANLANFASQLPALSQHLPTQAQISRMLAGRNHTSAGQYAAVFTLGLLVGGAAALLNAPMTGKELRHDISERAGKLRERARERIASNGHARRGHDAQL